MCDDQHALAVIFSAYHRKCASQSENHVAPALTTGRPVVELTERGTKGSLFGKALQDAVSGETIENAEFLLAKALVDHQSGRVAGVGEFAQCLEDIGRLARPQIRRGNDNRGPLINGEFAEPVAESYSLSLAEGRERDIH